MTMCFARTEEHFSVECKMCVCGCCGLVDLAGYAPHFSGESSFCATDGARPGFWTCTRPATSRGFTANFGAQIFLPFPPPRGT
mmetsp:Transcript_28390/g.74570  ORF Transcript_28390/g.74570 Transcript_28390/m.74570 type:complete len:83 (-) Transcript_28390:741-989(-)